MKKKLFFAALALVALASCTNDEFVGVEIPQDNSPSVSDAIMFSSVSKGTTRADHVGADAADMLGGEFVVGGFKGDGSTMTEVFDNYTVTWGSNTAGTTQSNTSDWEYVGGTPSPNSGVTAQTIKYWDYSTSQYDFAAYSLGNATVDVTEITTLMDGSNYKGLTYTIKGDRDDLAQCYISDMVTVYKAGASMSPAQPKYQDEVTLTFRNLSSKVRIALYETIPGYSVQDVKFYMDEATTIATGASSDVAYLFTTGTTDKDNFYKKGTYTVTFPTIGTNKIGDSDYNKAHVTFAATGKQPNRQFGKLNYGAAELYEAAGNNYLKRTSIDPSFTGNSSDHYFTVLPNEEGTVLELRIDYTLVSTDGGGETIKIYGAKAYVPAIYAEWKPNYAYTYLFKISDNTNGWTSQVVDSDGNPTDPAGLYPITFDAIVIDSQENEQTTITTVATPSITTYQLGHIYNESDEYKAGDIYVQVMQDGNLVTDLNTVKTKLYTVTARTDKTVTEADVMDALNIQESKSGNDITGRNGWELKSASITVDGVTKIPGVDGNDIILDASGKAAKFAATAGTYAFVYDYTGGVPATTNIYSAVTLTEDSAPDNFTTEYFMDPDGATACTAADYVKDKIYYKKYSNLNHTMAVKVIKVQ